MAQSERQASRISRLARGSHRVTLPERTRFAQVLADLGPDRVVDLACGTGLCSKDEAALTDAPGTRRWKRRSRCPGSVCNPSRRSSSRSNCSARRQPAAGEGRGERPVQASGEWHLRACRRPGCEHEGFGRQVGSAKPNGSRRASPKPAPRSKALGSRARLRAGHHELRPRVTALPAAARLLGIRLAQRRRRCESCWVGSRGSSVCRT